MARFPIRWSPPDAPERFYQRANLINLEVSWVAPACPSLVQYDTNPRGLMKVLSFRIDDIANLFPVLRQRFQCNDFGSGYISFHDIEVELDRLRMPQLKELLCVAVMNLQGIPSEYKTVVRQYKKHA